MSKYTLEELTQALTAIHSIIHKCEKAQEKFPEGNSHHTLLRNRLKAMYISESLITEKLSAASSSEASHQQPEAFCSPNILLSHLDELHTTELGAQRIQKNLNLTTNDIVGFCKEQIKSPNAEIIRKGKNWYITVNQFIITINAHSYTIITAHPSHA